jgi:HlyD family secretion protein
MIRLTFPRAAAFGAALLLAACKKDQPALLYEPVAVTVRDIVVSAEAAGAVEPILVVDVKSRASGTILRMIAETGDMVRQGDTLVVVDKRDPSTALAQAEADLAVAQAQLANAEAAKRRADQMFQGQLISEQEHEQANLTYANARAQLVRAQASVQNARDQLADTDVRAPISGTIIQKSVEAGQVIASATRDVSGGTVLLRMADLNEVQVRTLVDETDIGKIQPGMRATITVDAYPNRPFEGTVLKIEPQSQTSQNVTMFPVLIRIGNEQGLLRPGMNTEVEVHIGQRSGVLAIPNAALRTSRDVASAAQVLGLNPEDVDKTLARQDSIARANPQLAGAQGRPEGGRAATARPDGRASMGGSTPNRLGPEPVMAAVPPQSPPQGGGTMDGPPTGVTQGGAPSIGGFGGQQGGGPGGMNVQLPEGVTREMLGEIRRKRQAGEPLTSAESTASARMREAFQRQGGMSGPGAGGQQGGQPGAPQGGAAPASPAGGEQGGGMGGFQLPPGVTQEQARAAFTKLREGQQLTPQEQAIMTRLRSSMGSGNSQRRRFGAGNSFQFGGSYIVFVLRDGKPTPVRIQTGLTDLDYSEVRSGLTEQDTVLLLPSASLVQSQTEMRDRFQRMAGGGGVPGMKQQAPAVPGGGGRPGGAPGGGPR